MELRKKGTERYAMFAEEFGDVFEQVFDKDMKEKEELEARARDEESEKGTKL